MQKVIKYDNEDNALNKYWIKQTQTAGTYNEQAVINKASQSTGDVCFSSK